MGWSIYLNVIKKSNWDLTFEEFIRFSMFKMDCHEEIKGLYKDMKETATEFSDENFTEDDVAHDLFLYLKESFSSKTQEFLGSWKINSKSIRRVINEYLRISME